tara:strand:+ start:484 stop:894 length:411 start_codon:yes stop_codon:yes gene_type:complete
MSSILKVNTLTGVTTAGSIVVTGEGNSNTTNLQQGLAKAHANVDMTGTAALDGSFNISGLTDSGTGQFLLTISSDMGNANYSFSVGFNDQSSDVGPVLKVVGESGIQTGQISFQKKENNSFVDCDVNCVHIMGDLA